MPGRPQTTGYRLSSVRESAESGTQGGANPGTTKAHSTVGCVQHSAAGSLREVILLFHLLPAWFWAAQYKTGRFYSWLTELEAIRNRKRAGELTQLLFLGTSYCGEQGEEGQITPQHIRLCSLYSCTYMHT